MRLIDADKLLENSWDVDCRVGYVQVVDVGTIEEAPTIDAVPVVCCEDCRYYGNTKKHKRCGECSWHNRMAYPDDYCSYGERRENK